MTKPTIGSVRLSVESLTDRVVPSVSLISSEIYIFGSEGGDSVEVVAAYTDGGYEYRVTENEVTTSIPVDMVTGRVVFHGGGGDDSFVNNTSLPTEARGGEGNDILVGGWGDDYLFGEGNDDYLVGRSGYDSLHGHAGSDWLDDQGTDFAPTILFGGGGDDVLYGGNGPDQIYGGGGIDTLAGLDGDDYLNGGNGTDYMFGHEGNDRLVAGEDFTWNYLEGGTGNDTLLGANGMDYMFGGAGMDYLYGHGGDDYLDGGDDEYSDWLFGGGGNDYFQIDWYSDEWYALNQDMARDWTPWDEIYDA